MLHQLITEVLRAVANGDVLHSNGVWYHVLAGGKVVAYNLGDLRVFEYDADQSAAYLAAQGGFCQKADPERAAALEEHYRSFQSSFPLELV